LKPLKKDELSLKFTGRDRSECRPSNCWVYYTVLELFGTDAEMSHSPGSFSVAKIENYFITRAEEKIRFRNSLTMEKCCGC
jgi:hypothetical protein